ncbi:sigma factor-like helix-turn-helix DNA-binding protein [Clostridium combesii]|uniref:RNA polymerase sigma-70 region 4 domain-containing protein n=1 Tax=Clostridium combesii TaxID=39481 RepID=A0A2G7HJF4_9CLOT|nr:sigma factor-like helix-turn-helix DNA-binding protein [Clostridium combesii]PIH05225.1 hypothetical protein CS538_05190 [Clostridium combesii]
MDEYIKKTENLLKNYKEYMVMIKNDALDPKERKHIVLQLKKVNNVLEILSEEEKNIINLVFFNKLPYKEVGNILGLCESTIGYKKKDLIKKIAPIIFVAELSYEEKFEFN